MEKSVPEEGSIRHKVPSKAKKNHCKAESPSPNARVLKLLGSELCVVQNSIGTIPTECSTQLEN